MLDLKSHHSSLPSLSKSDTDLGPLSSVIRQEALPLAIRLLGANFHSQESIVSFSNILTETKRNPAHFLGLAVSLINLLKSHQEGGALEFRHEEEDSLHLSQFELELKKNNMNVLLMRQHFDSCHNVIEVLLCLFRWDPPTFCSTDAAGGLLLAMQDFLLECARVFKVYHWCQEHLVAQSIEKNHDAEKDAKKKSKRRDSVYPIDSAEYKLCAQSCAEVALSITFEAMRLLQIINSIAFLSPSTVKDFFAVSDAVPKSSAPECANFVGIFCTVLSEVTRDANSFFRDHRLPENERVDVSCILKNVIAANFCSLVCIHHITSTFPIEMNQMQVYNMSLCAFSSISCGLQFFSQPSKNRRFKKLAAFKEAVDMTVEDIASLKSVLETLITCILLNLAHAALSSSVLPHAAPHHSLPSLPTSAPHGEAALSNPQLREILNQLLLWCVRGGGLQAAAAVVVASFAEARLLQPHRLIVRVLLQKSTEDVAAAPQGDLEGVSADDVSRARQRHHVSVEFLRELMNWIDGLYFLQPPASLVPLLPYQASDAKSAVFNINKLPSALQVSRFLDHSAQHLSNKLICSAFARNTCCAGIV
jgi:hypothetical protein